MPAPKTYYSAADIMNVLGVGRNKAYEILHMFEVKGKAFHFGRVIRVRSDYFEKWLAENDQETAKQHKLASVSA